MGAVGTEDAPSASFPLLMAITRRLGSPGVDGCPVGVVESPLLLADPFICVGDGSSLKGT